MKPCRENRKLISLLVSGCLDARDAAGLHAHLATCQECRRYLEKTSRTRDRLVSTRATEDISASELLHRRIMSRLRAQPSEPPWSRGVEALVRSCFGWRVALPLALVLLAVIWTVAVRTSKPSPPSASALVDDSLAPTLANYQMVADGSLDRLDQLITMQSQQNPPPAVVYTASGFIRNMAE